MWRTARRTYSSATRRRLFLLLVSPDFSNPNGLVPGTTYYWRVDEVNEADPASPWKGDVWSFLLPPKIAHNPGPADAGASVGPNAELVWTAGFGAKLHTTYFGDNFDDVKGASGGFPQSATTYNPGPLELEKVYYWRVDEFDGLETHRGEVWSFATSGAIGNPQPANGVAEVPLVGTLSHGGQYSIYNG